MSGHVNEFGQPIGQPLPDWKPPPLPPRESVTGRFCRLEPLDPAAHSAQLFEAYSRGDGSSWTYLPVGPFEEFETFREWQARIAPSTDPHFYAIIDLATGRATGMCSYLGITPAAGSIEVGHLHFSDELRRTPATTEAMYLMMRWAFNAGYRRYEWKCDALNAGSRRAAERLGLAYEGTFRQATVYKGRTRDTAWYAAIDTDWPHIHAAFLAWLSPDNFDPEGTQKVRLPEFMRVGSSNYEPTVE
jgi:RimJ/RimL family protein N-acetyltransferase